MFGLALNARERRTVFLGAAAAVLMLAVVFIVLPFVRQWRAREDVMAAETQRLERLRGLVTAEAQMREAVSTRGASLEAWPHRLLAGRNAARAASALQTLLQDYADQSRLSVSRLDVAGAPDTTRASLPAAAATVSAMGDIYGITEMLSLLQNGPRLLEIAELTVRPNPALRGELLQMTVKLRAVYVGG